MKVYAKIVERVGRLKDRYHVGSRYRIEITRHNDRVIDLTWEKLTRPISIAPGEYVLRTSRRDLSDRALSQTHRMPGMIEFSFRRLKSSQGLGPKFHHHDRSIRAQILVTVSASFVPAADDYVGHLAKILVSHIRVTISQLTKDHRQIDIRTSTDPTARQLAIDT